MKGTVSNFRVLSSILTAPGSLLCVLSAQWCVADKIWTTYQTMVILLRPLFKNSLKLH